MLCGRRRGRRRERPWGPLDSRDHEASIRCETLQGGSDAFPAVDQLPPKRHVRQGSTVDRRRPRGCPHHARRNLTVQQPSRRVSLVGVVVGRPQVIRDHMSRRRRQFDEERRRAARVHRTVEPLGRARAAVAVDGVAGQLAVGGMAVWVGGVIDGDGLSRRPEEHQLLQLEVPALVADRSEDKLESGGSGACCPRRLADWRR